MRRTLELTSSNACNRVAFSASLTHGTPTANFFTSAVNEMISDRGAEYFSFFVFVYVTLDYDENSSFFFSLKWRLIRGQLCGHKDLPFDAERKCRTCILIFNSGALNALESQVSFIFIFEAGSCRIVRLVARLVCL